MGNKNCASGKYIGNLKSIGSKIEGAGEIITEAAQAPLPGFNVGAGLLGATVRGGGHLIEKHGKTLEIRNQKKGCSP